MYQSKDIAIVILNWNGKHLLTRFLPSIVKNSDNAKIYLVDNHSTDDSVTFVSHYYPGVKCIQNSTNAGYAGGYNLALKHINEPVLCLLNNDVEVTEGWLNAVLDRFNTDKNTAVIQPKLLDYSNTSFFEYAGAAGGFIDKYGYPYCRGRMFNSIEQDNGQYNDPAEILWASGACFFIRNSVFKTLGGFDEAFFAHMEEIDLCWRAFNLNYNAFYEPKSVVYHFGGATLSSLNPKKTYLNFRNSLYTLVKNADKFVISKVLVRLILDGVAALRFLFKLQPSHLLAILKAHFSFYLHLKTLINQRRKLPKRSGYYKVTSIVWSYFVLGKRKI
jgi:GT2 family glycosyltransferase